MVNGCGLFGMVPGELLISSQKLPSRASLNDLLTRGQMATESRPLIGSRSWLKGQRQPIRRGHAGCWDRIIQSETELSNTLLTFGQSQATIK